VRAMTEKGGEGRPLVADDGAKTNTPPQNMRKCSCSESKRKEGEGYRRRKMQLSATNYSKVNGSRRNVASNGADQGAMRLRKERAANGLGAVQEKGKSTCASSERRHRSCQDRGKGDGKLGLSGEGEKNGPRTAPSRGKKEKSIERERSLG